MTITLYATNTSNCFKVTTYLELLELKYDVKYLSLPKKEHKEPWFIKLNPNGRLPTLADDSTGITISETGAILQYLADTYDKEHKFSYPHGTKEYYQLLEVLLLQVAGIGPMTGQAFHFVSIDEKIPYAINRYSEESSRLWLVVEEYLNRSSGDYLVGDKFSIADAATFPWFLVSHNVGVDVKKFPKTFAWAQRLAKVPAIQKGLTVPEPTKFNNPEIIN